MLAELMLPDQTHVRSQDWTIFFLHKDTSGEEEEAAEREAKRKRRKEENAVREEGSIQSNNDDDEELSSSDEEDEDEEEGREGPALMYVLNLVNTKQDTTAKRYVLQACDRVLPLISVAEAQLLKPWQFVRDILSCTYIKYGFPLAARILAY